MDLLGRWKTIQLLGVDPETRAGLGELRFSVIDHGKDVTLYVDIPAATQLRGAVAAFDTLYFELLAGTRDSALYALRNLHADQIDAAEQRRVGGR